MLGDEKTTVQDDDVDQLNMVLYLKDKHNIFQVFEILKYVCKLLIFYIFQVFEILKYVCKLLIFYALYRKHIS